jgi:hypothetical protein
MDYNGSETRVHDAAGISLGRSDEYGTYDAAGVKVSDSNCPGMLIER